MLALVARVAPSMATVLLLGESGTGKELVARAVHEASPRAAPARWWRWTAPACPRRCSSPSCSATSAAPSPAPPPRAPAWSRPPAAARLFLDEVGDIPLPMQVKLLRLLETGTYRRVGSTELRHADIRVVSATHRDLDQMVRDGRFREDLYYRLSTFPIQLPALRERRDDIPLLAAALLERVAAPQPAAISPAALDLLQAQPFPGNVRELRNLMERAALLCDGDTLDLGHVQQALGSGRAPRPARAAEAAAELAAPLATVAESPVPWPTEAPPGDLRSLEQAALLERVARHPGSRATLAAELGISERTLYRKLKAAGAA
jgi:DNA-binding NtrC family response regulator